MPARPAPPSTPRLALAALLLVLASCALVRAVTGAGFQPPSLTYESWSPQEVDLDGVTIALRYRLDNPNDFDVDVRSLAYRLDVEGHEIVDGTLPSRLLLRGHGVTWIDFPVRLHWRSVPGMVGLLLTRSEVAYRVTGRAGVGSLLGTVEVPFEHADRVALPRPPLLQELLQLLGVSSLTPRDPAPSARAPSGGAPLSGG